MCITTFLPGNLGYILRAEGGERPANIAGLSRLEKLLCEADILYLLMGGLALYDVVSASDSCFFSC